MGSEKRRRTMLASIEKLREISHRCLNDQPLDAELSNWLGNSLQEFLEHSCRTIDEAFGLRFARGGVPWWREEAIRLRDAALGNWRKGSSTRRRWPTRPKSSRACQIATPVPPGASITSATKCRRTMPARRMSSCGAPSDPAPRCRSANGNSETSLPNDVTIELRTFWNSVFHM